MKLECGSHVSRLLCKLPHDLQTSFRQSVHPQRVPIPTMLDLSVWLEFELQVQEDSTRFYPQMSKPMPIHKRGHQRDTRQPTKATSIFLGTKKDSSDMTETPKVGHSESFLVNTTTETLYLDRPTDSRRVLLKICKVLLRNGSQCLETYALLDDGSERTILLHSSAQQLGLTGRPEELVLRTVRQDLQILHGASVTFTVSPASQPKT